MRRWPLREFELASRLTFTMAGCFDELLVRPKVAPKHVAEGSSAARGVYEGPPLEMSPGYLLGTPPVHRRPATCASEWEGDDPVSGPCSGFPRCRGSLGDSKQSDVMLSVDMIGPAMIRGEKTCRQIVIFSVNRLLRAFF